MRLKNTEQEGNTHSSLSSPTECGELGHASSLGRGQERPGWEVSEVSWDAGPCVNRMPAGKGCDPILLNLSAIIRAVLAHAHAKNNIITYAFRWFQISMIKYYFIRYTSVTHGKLELAKYKLCRVQMSILQHKEIRTHSELPLTSKFELAYIFK